MASLSHEELVHRSKFLSLVLRHQPEKVGITLDDAGWVDVDDLLAACAHHGVEITRSQLDDIVAGNDKRRFAFNADFTRIRASQGHSVEVELGYQAAAPPARLYHGTVAAAIPAIRTAGLQPMARHAVHLSAELATAKKVGGRRGSPIVLTVLAADMHAAGHEFQVSANGVWLTAQVPAEYIDFPQSWGPGSLLTGGGDRKAIARDTLAVCDAGRYTSPGGIVVEVGDAIADAISGTVVHDPASLAAVAIPVAPAEGGGGVRIEVTAESTVAAVLRLAAEGAAGIGAMNFASAKKPGGGFLNGAQAQEEAVARASALYPALLTANERYYTPNRAEPSALYLDLVVVSPGVPFFRDDRGTWLEAPVRATVITAAAPNASALRQQGVEAEADLARVEEVLRRRAELVLRAAVAAGVKTFVLGAWGAGVFGNEPDVVADAFGVLLEGDGGSGGYGGAFERVVFAVLDGKKGKPVLGAFAKRFGVEVEVEEEEVEEEEEEEVEEEEEAEGEAEDVDVDVDAAVGIDGAVDVSATVVGVVDDRVNDNGGAHVHGAVAVDDHEHVDVHADVDVIAEIVDSDEEADAAAVDDAKFTPTVVVPRQTSLPFGARGAGTISRQDKKRVAAESLSACSSGRYVVAGKTVELRALIDRAVTGTKVWDPASVASVGIPGDRANAVEVTGETTMVAIRRLAGRPGLGVLNFASAKRPGGGFLEGSQAQEESLARASALYPCLVTCKASYYDVNRAFGSAIYPDLAIASPEVPFFRDDDGAWLEAPVLATVITCAAPNAGELRKKRADTSDVEPALRRRAELILRVAVAHDIRTLILGAWGTGVFGNDATTVASAFGDHLGDAFSSAFDAVVFAVLDTRPSRPIHSAFSARFW